MNKEYSTIEKDINRELKPKRTEITIEKDGEKINVWTEYEIEPVEFTGKCSRCNKENKKMWIEKIKKIMVESDDQEIISKVEKKLNILIDTIEKMTAVCADCFDDEFIKNRPQKYIEALEKVQDKLSIVTNKEEQRKNILAINDK